jgi:hypothetical protein
MLAIISLLVIVTLSITVTKVATVALARTGLSREAARFQARSSFTGVGFTTSESERIVRHPVRRRIVLFLMLLGNAGLITAVSSLILCVNDRRAPAPAAQNGSSVGCPEKSATSRSRFSSARAQPRRRRSAALLQSQ